MKRIVLAFLIATSTAALGQTLTPQYLPCTSVGSTRTCTATLRDKGGQVFNAKAYGAVGDGSTDDTAAISAMITAETAAGGGILYFPPGNYYSATCGFSITKPTTIEGAGQKAVDSALYGSMLTCASTTNHLINAATDLLAVHDMALSGPTAGTETNYGIYFNGPTIHARFNFFNLSINGFRDAIFVNAGAYWSIRDTHIINPIRYGVNINNVLNNDEGDWAIDNLSCVSGTQTNNVTTPGSSACIAQFSSGGGKISKIKSNTKFTHGYYGNLAGSVQLLMTQNDIEATANAPIYIAEGWPYITIVGNFLSAPDGYPAIYAVDLNAYVITGNDLESGAAAPMAIPAIQLAGSNQLGTIGINHMHPNFAPQPYTVGHRNIDFSNTVGFSSALITANQDTVNVGCDVNGCSNSAILNFLGQSSATPYDGSIVSDANGNGGMTFKLARDVGGSNIGYHFQPHGSATDFLYIDSVTGALITQHGNNLDSDASGDMVLGVNANLQMAAGRAFSWSGANGISNDSGTVQSMHIDAAAKTGAVFVSGSHSTYGVVDWRTAIGGTLLGGITNSGDIYNSQISKGVILRSPDGTCYRITVANGGTISAGSTTCPY